ncbi:MAG: DUF4292 domain-containing protein [Reichenbachiella sp.]
MNRLIFCLLCVLALSSCSKKLHLFSTDPDKFNLNNVNYEFLSLRSKIKYEDSDNKQKGTANIRIKNDSIIWFSITPGMGIEAARGIILEDTVKVINKIDKSYSIESIQKMMGAFHFDFNLDMVESILIGNLIWPIAEDDKVTRSKGYFIVPKKYDDLTITNFIGASSKKVEKIEAISDSSSNTLNIQYSNFQKISEKIVPSKVDVQIKYTSQKDDIQKMSNITIEHSKVEIDNAKLRFSFTIPKKYKRR